MDERDERRARSAGSGRPDEFVRDSLERILAEEAQHVAGVLEGLTGKVSPLSREDLDGVRSIVRQARERV